MNNNYETIDQKLDRIYDKKKATKPVKPSKIKKVKPKKEKTKKSKQFIVGMVALVTAGAIALGSGVAYLVNYFKKKNNDVPQKPNTSISTMRLDDMGTELEFQKKEENTSKYGEITGNVDVNKVVEKNDKVYVDQESADKSDNVGNVVIDTQNDTLKVEQDGTVKEKTEGYEIKNEQGEVIEQGNLNEDELPDNFEYNEELDGVFEKEDNTSTLTYSDSDYYDQNGYLVLVKGDLVEKDRLEYAKKHYSTTKPTVETTPIETTPSTEPVIEETTPIETTPIETTPSTEPVIEETTPIETTPIETTPIETTPSTEPTIEETTEPQNEGVINEDGTYTIYGVTYADKATFEQIALSDLETLDMYLDENGVLHIKTEELENQLTKTK